MTDMVAGAALCALVLLLVAVFGLFLDHRDHRRHARLEGAIEQMRKTLTVAITQYGRLDGEVRDLRETVDDHAAWLGILLPAEKIRRPKP